MTLKKGVYDTIKWIALIFLPAAGTLYAALALVWSLKYTVQVTNSVLAVDTFLGALVGISSKGYTPSVDGHLYVAQTSPDSVTARMESALGVRTGYLARYSLRYSSCMALEKVSLVAPGSASRGCRETVTPVPTVKTPSLPMKRKP